MVGDFPSYELFTDRLRQGALEHGEGRQLQILLGADREIKIVSQF